MNWKDPQPIPAPPAIQPATPPGELDRMVAEGRAAAALRNQRKLRVQLLRIAAEIAPRLTGGVRAEDVVERARIMELYVSGSPPGSADAGTDTPAETSGPESTERGVPEPGRAPGGEHPEGQHPG